MERLERTIVCNLVVYAQIEWDMLLQIGDYFAVRHMPLSPLLIRVSEGSGCLV